MIKFTPVIALFLVISLMLISSCADGKDKQVNSSKSVASKAEMKTSIKNMEDTLKMMQSKKQPIENLHRLELINRLRLFYETYPKDEYSATCLDNIHMIYSGMGVHDLSIAYADTLLEKYPKYANRAMILESQGSNYDIFSSPRDSTKVRYYYTKLLKEFPKLDKEKRQGIIDRLSQNHLTFDEFINKKIKDMAIK